LTLTLSNHSAQQIFRKKMSATSDINTSGTFLNLLCNGARTQDCIGEELDNSMDAGATMIDIHLHSDSNTIIIADNGKGMTQRELKTAYILNNRTTETNEKQGRYGYGINLAKAHLTQLKATVSTISKSAEDSIANQIEINWPTIIKENCYRNNPVEVSRANEPKYNKYVKNAFNTETGTVHIIPCDFNVFAEIQNAMISTKIIESWRYLFGLKYNEYIKNGTQIRFIVDETSQPIIVMPIDPLVMEKLPELRKTAVVVEIWRDVSTGELLPNIPDRGWMVTGRYNKTVFKNEPLPSTFEKVAELTHESSYTTDWATVQGELFEEGAFDQVVQVNSTTNKRTANQQTVEYMGGRYYNRNRKNIDRATIRQPKSGDKARYSFVTNSRHRINFPVELDNQMGIQVNKSKIQEELIHPTIKRVCDFLEKEFADKFYEEYKSTLPKKTVITKQQALEMFNKIITKFGETQEHKHFHVNEMIDVILKMSGKSNPDEFSIRKLQWKIVADKHGADTIVEVLKTTIESQPEANIMGGESLNDLFDNISN
jgi:hypothetical protein